MTKVLCCVSVFLAWATSLAAQSAAPAAKSKPVTSQTVKYLTGPSGEPATAGSSSNSQTPMLNILTVIGANAPGLPCLDCLLGLLIPSLGLPAPADRAYRGDVYQIDSFLIDNNYTGACTFTFTVMDSHKNVIVSTSETLTETAGTQILLSTPVTIPETAYVGLGSVSNTAVCGSNTTRSQSPVMIACVTNPPYCVE